MQRRHRTDYTDSPLEAYDELQQAGFVKIAIAVAPMRECSMPVHSLDQVDERLRGPL